MSVYKAEKILKDMGYISPQKSKLPDSDKRFPDGSHYRFEIPSVEGPSVMKALLDELKRKEQKVHRISQGSGIMMLLDDEIQEMCKLAKENEIELSLFVGPRGTWDISAGTLTPNGKMQALKHEGIHQVMYALEDLLRGAELGLRGALIADEGLLKIANELKIKGVLPENFVFKISAQLMVTNPVSAKLLVEMGASTINVPSSLSIEKLFEIRQAVDVPFDLYVETPDTLGGFLRYYEVPEMIRVLSPIYLKMGMRNHQDVYPAGQHLEQLNISLAKERVRRLQLSRAMIVRYLPDAIESSIGAVDLGIPQ
ncbi:U32 family peptidase [Bacillus infantis]|uniref:U32 family peptidase n=1 Tax=Bacillus infantis TaxID=324767 RepID=UPI0020035CB0|nr:U32 family peptidase [Bacillus infantis]MCK6205245.1 U32 family peptidase [Bacillus infantis]